jgi:hypothetical protein
MINSMPKLYDHVNRFHVIGRWEGKEGDLHTYGNGQVALYIDREPSKQKTRPHIPRQEVLPLPVGCVSPGADQPLELRRCGDKEWVPAWEYDEEAVAAHIMRLEALTHYETLVGNYERLTQSIRDAVADMHPDDQRVFAHIGSFSTLRHVTDEYRKEIG